MNWLAVLSVLVGAGGDGFELEPVVAGLTRPVWVTSAPDDPDRLLVVEQRDAAGMGHVRIVEDGRMLAEPFLSIGPLATAYSQGLLCLAFDPAWHENGWIYVVYTAATQETVVARFDAAAGGAGVDPESEHVVITIPQPHHFHNGGWCGFGPDGYLYVSSGDGGPGGDPEQRGQDTSVLLGKLLRLDVHGDDFPADPLANYAIPPDNPFVGVAGRDEIWAYGLREAWRCSFDRLTGDLYVADVGEDGWEEINVEPAGGVGGRNYGWRCVEGPDDFADDPECAETPLLSPLVAYDHAAGECAVVGGDVYRGSRVRALVGRYLFADHCTGRLRSFRLVDGRAADHRAHETAVPGQTTSFGAAADGELYVCTLDGALYRVRSTCGTSDLLAVLEGLGTTSDVADLLEVLECMGR